MAANTKDIRNGTVSLLNDALVIPVIASKVTPSIAGSLPNICVYTEAVQAENLDTNSESPIFRRTINLVFVVSVKQTTEWADAVDDTIYNIKATLFQNEPWVRQFENIAGYTEEHSATGDGEQPIAVGILTIQCVLVEPEAFVGSP